MIFTPISSFLAHCTPLSNRFAPIFVYFHFPSSFVCFWTSYSAFLQSQHWLMIPLLKSPATCINPISAQTSNPSQTHFRKIFKAKFIPPLQANHQGVELSRKVSFALHAQLLPFLMSSLQPQTRGGWPCVHTCFSPHRKCSHTCVGVFATLCIPLCDEKKHTPHLCAVTRAYLLFPIFFLFH